MSLRKTFGHQLRFFQFILFNLVNSATLNNCFLFNFFSRHQIPGFVFLGFLPFQSPWMIPNQVPLELLQSFPVPHMQLQISNQLQMQHLLELSHSEQQQQLSFSRCIFSRFPLFTIYFISKLWWFGISLWLRSGPNPWLIFLFILFS
jgi:hypothetical protein